MVPLDDMFNNEKYKTDGKKLQKDDFFKGFLKDSYYEGKFYSMPVFGEIEMIALRKDLFDKAGIPIPKTWDELRDAAIKLTSSDMWGYSTCWARITLLKVIFSAVKGRGGRVLDEKGNLSFNDPITREAIKWFVDLRNKDKAMQPNIHEEFNNSRDEWKKGKVAIFHNWLSWGIEGAKLIGEDKVEYIPVPGTSKNGTMIYMGGVIVPKAGHVELAKLFIAEEIEAKWFQQWSFNHYGKNPVRRQNIEGLKLKVNWDDVIGAIDNGETLPVYEDLLKMSDTAVKYLTLALTGKMDVDSACDKIYKEISTMKK
ncbi:MAG TPA: extracellular solute-binding protein [Candidatus Atribacteria bacterium]|nr:extracellular solute-binding protein [Candidatus Atribacteria bacterium]